MGKARSDLQEILNQLIEWAARPEGVSLTDPMFKNWVITAKAADPYLRILVKNGRLFAGKRSLKVVRYFTKIDAAQSYVDRHTANTVTIKSVKGWGKDDPAIYPTKPDGSPAYKVTIAPPPPERVYRTATHSVIP